MHGLRVILVALFGLLTVNADAGAQVPDALRSAMRARDSAFFKADVAAWDRYTANSFTTVQQDGTMMTKAERLTHLATQPPRPFVTRSQEQIHRYGDIYVVRFRSNDLWVLEVWSRENGAWKSVASQVTTAKK